MTCHNISYFNPEFQGNNHSLKEVMFESFQAKTKKMHLKNGFSCAFKKQVLTGIRNIELLNRAAESHAGETQWPKRGGVGKEG